MDSHDLAKLLLSHPNMPVATLDRDPWGHCDVTAVDRYTMNGFNHYIVLSDLPAHNADGVKHVAALWPRPPGVNRPTLENIGGYVPPPHGD